MPVIKTSTTKLPPTRYAMWAIKKIGWSNVVQWYLSRGIATANRKWYLDSSQQLKLLQLRSLSRPLLPTLLIFQTVPSKQQKRRRRRWQQMHWGAVDLHQCFQLSYLHPNRNSQAQLRSQMLIPMRRRGSPCRLTGCRASLARLTSTARPPGNLNLTPLERFTCADGWTGAENFALVFVSDAQFLSFYVCQWLWIRPASSRRSPWKPGEI